MSDDELWVGCFKNSGDIFLYDPEINAPDTETVKLFIKKKLIVEEVYRANLRGTVEKVENKTTQIITKSAYRRWQRKQNRQILERRIEKDKKEIRRVDCYCGEVLNSRSNKTCPKCGWLICSQYHCGCTYDGLV